MGNILLFVAGISVITILILWGIISSIKECRKEERAHIAEKEQQQTICDNTKPGVVKFVIGDEIYTSAACAPEVRLAYRLAYRSYYLSTGVNEADRLMRYFYETGSYRNKENVTFPACNVTQAYVEELT